MCGCESYILRNKMNLINIKKINNYKSNIARILSSIMAKSCDECDLPY